jgi:hypothetical protein
VTQNSFNVEATISADLWNEHTKILPGGDREAKRPQEFISDSE